MNPELIKNECEYQYAFPVDTWVIQIAQKLDCRTKKLLGVREYLIGKCKDYKINILKFAVGYGIWELIHSILY
jgi:hypothetical protein